MVGTEAFSAVILSKHHQKASFKPWSEVYPAPGPENCPPRATKIAARNGRLRKATSSRQAPTPDFSCTTARAQILEHPNSYALLDGILDSTRQTGDMAPFRSAPKSACASTHPRSKRSSPPPPSHLHLDSNQAGGRRHGGRTPPRWSTADIHHESGNKHNTANAVHFGLPAG